MLLLCMLSCRSLEQGPAETSGLRELFTVHMEHLSPDHIHFFRLLVCVCVCVCVHVCMCTFACVCACACVYVCRCVCVCVCVCVWCVHVCMLMRACTRVHACVVCPRTVYHMYVYVQLARGSVTTCSYTYKIN